MTTMRTFMVIAAALVVGHAAYAQTGTNKSPADLNNEVFSLFPDNTIHLITPYNARQMLLDVIASFTNGGTSGGTVVQAINSAGSPVVQGAPVYVTGSGTVAPAQANGFSTSGVLGIANALIAPSGIGGVVVTGPLVLSTAQWDAVVTGESGGLTSGTLYFLDSAVTGKLTATAPSTPGQVVTLIGRAISPTTLIITIGAPLLL
jgi:hypothetical protein